MIIGEMLTFMKVTIVTIDTISAKIMEILDGIDLKIEQETKCLTILQDKTIVRQDNQVSNAKLLKDKN